MLFFFKNYCKFNPEQKFCFLVENRQNRMIIIDFVQIFIEFFNYNFSSLLSLQSSVGAKTVVFQKNGAGPATDGILRTQMQNTWRELSNLKNQKSAKIVYRLLIETIKTQQISSFFMKH